MSNDDLLTRRAFLKTSAAGLAAAASSGATLPAFAARRRRDSLPVGLELYSVRDHLAKDPKGTVTAVAKMGYQVVEFYAPYFQWTTDQAKETRKLLDDLGIACHSTHNGRGNFRGDNFKKAIELNQIIGSQTIVMSSAGKVDGPDGWKKVGDELTLASETLKPLGMRAGYHNHNAEFIEKDGQFPLQIVAANTPQDVTLQFDVGTCMSTGHDPIAWINANPGRIRSLHLKPWSKAHGYKVLFFDDETPWTLLLDAAQLVGGAEYVLIEQETSPLASSLDAAAQDLANFRRLHAV